MAELYVMSDEQKHLWTDWVAERPPIIKDLCARFLPNRLYHLKTTDQRVIPSAFYEDNTLLVIVPRLFNGGIFPTKSVFGIKPDDLEECDLPNGYATMTFDDYEQLLNTL